MKKETTLRLYTTEMRALTDEAGVAVITGTPIVFNQETRIGDDEYGFYEVIRPSALANADLSDVVLTVEHDGRKIPLARTKKGRGTMTLAKTATGLDMRAELDIENNTEARALYSAISRGDMDQMSFLFVIAPEGDNWTYEKDVYKREITNIAQVLDVSVVTRPAYDGTSVQLSRSEVDAKEEARARVDRENEVEALKLKNRILAGIQEK